MTAEFLTSPTVERLGWVLVHSLWQFTLIALLAVTLARLLPARQAAARYGILLLGLVFLVATSFLTFQALPPTEANTNSAAEADRAPLAAVEISRHAHDDSRADLISTAPTAETRPNAAEPDANRSGVAGSTRAIRPHDFRSRIAAWTATFERVVRPSLRWIVGAWCLGVLAFACRPVLSWYMVHRLRHIGVTAVPENLAAALDRVSRRLQVRQSVALLQSAMVNGPVVVGWLRPAILLPVSVVTNLPMWQMEAVLAHELAHIRRHDYFVNLLQALVETMCFYHPAVWWLSHRVRLEREHCCDDVAAAASESRVEYGRALLALEELRGSLPTLAVGAHSGSLLSRVHRLLQPAPNRQLPVAGGAIGLGIMAAFLIGAATWAVEHHDEPIEDRDAAPHGGYVDAVSDRFATALEGLKLPFVGPEELAALRREMRDYLTARVDSPVSDELTRIAVRAVEQCVPGRFANRHSYLTFRDEFDMLCWQLWVLSERRELTPEEAMRRDNQREWMRDYIRGLPIFYASVLARLEALLVRWPPGFPVGDRRIVSNTDHFSFRAEVFRGDGDWIMGHQVAGQRDYFDVARNMVIQQPQPLNDAATEKWLMENKQGDLWFDAQTQRLIPVRGARLAVLEETEWHAVDRISLKELRRRLDEFPLEAYSLAHLGVRTDPFRVDSALKALPTLVLESAAGQIVLMRIKHYPDENSINLQVRPRPLWPNPPFHPGDPPFHRDDEVKTGQTSSVPGSEQADVGKQPADRSLPMRQRGVSLKTTELTRAQALREICRQAGASLKLDRAGLAATKIDLDERIDVKIEDLPLHEAFPKLIDYRAHPGIYREVRGDAIFLTTSEARDERIRSRVPESLQPFLGNGFSVRSLDENSEIEAVSISGPLADELVQRIKTLPGLRKLNLGRTARLTDIGLAQLGELRLLQSLEVHSDQGLGDDILRSIKRLELLNELSISESGVTDAGIRRLQEMPQLTTLRIYQEGLLTDAALASIGTLSNLKNLELTSHVKSEKYGWMRFGTEGIQQLSQLRNLESLQLAGQELPAEGFALPSLRSLSIDAAQVHDDFAKALSECRELRSLSLSRSQITDAGLEQIAALPELQNLSIEEAPITDDGLRHLQRCAHLESLSLRGLEMTDAGVVYLVQCKRLKQLELWASDEMTIGGLQQLKALEDLQRLKVYGFCDMSEYASLFNLATLTASQLQHLDFTMSSTEYQAFLALEKSLPGTRIFTGAEGWLHVDR